MSTSAPQPAQSPGGTAGVGQPGFVARHGLFSDEQAEAARALVRQIPGVQRTETFLSLADVEPANFTLALLDQMAELSGRDPAI